MKKKAVSLKNRVKAFALAVSLGVTSIAGYTAFRDKVYAGGEEAERIVFAEGSGTGRDFGTTNDFEWEIDGKYKNSGSYVESAQSKPGIVNDNEYLKDNSSVIRLIRGVKANENGSGIEDISSDQEFRTGKALLKKSFKLDENSEFAAKFTISMPEAAVNEIQAGGSDYSREFGGDGITFFMTTNANPEVTAGSGIGYQGMVDSIAIEMDSFFNGAYYTEVAGDNAYANNGFDNQVVLKGHSTNYVNVGHKERFDHIAVLNNGDVKNHVAIKYLNNVVPSYDNFAWSATKSTNIEDFTSNCETRFADRKVNTRLFTVWVEYKNGKMNVSYANGNFATANRPAEPQLKDISIDLSKFKNKDVYIGFTSAIGTSKANHTVHAIQFQNFGDPVTDKAPINVEYYYQDTDEGDTYTIDSSKTQKIEELTVGSSILDSDYKVAGEKKNYEYTTVPGASVSEVVVTPDGTATLKIYYKLKGKANYQLRYYKKDKNGNYVKSEESDIKTDYIGNTVTAESIDASYLTKYNAEHYSYVSNVNDGTNKTVTSVLLENVGETYFMNVYYAPDMASYTLDYYKKGTDGNYVLDEEISGKVIKSDIVGSVHYPADIDPSFGTRYPNYKVNNTKSDTSITLEEKDGVGHIKVYYDPQIAYYKIHYWKYDPINKIYSEVTSDLVDKTAGNVGTTVKVIDVDAGYAAKYTNYVLSTEKTQELSAVLAAENNVYDMNVYYEPEKASYTVRYFKKQPNGEYELVTEDSSKVVKSDFIGTTHSITDIDAAYISKYPNFKINTSKTNSAGVKLETVGETYNLDVYYDPEEAGYKLNYYKLDPNTEKYVPAGSTDSKTGTVGTTYVAADADSEYETRFSGEDYSLSTVKTQELSIKIDNATDTFEMNAYYDPAKAPYKTEYYLQQPDGTYKLEETMSGESTWVGKIVNASEKTYTGYKEVEVTDTIKTGTVKKDGSTTLKVYYNYTKKPSYTVEHYVQQKDGTYKLYGEPEKNISATTGEKVTALPLEIKGYTHNASAAEAHETDTVKADSSTVLKVYYDLSQAKYTVDYYKFNVSTNKYERVDADSSKTICTGYLFETHEVSEVDPDYGAKYDKDNYSVNTLESSKDENSTVLLSEKDKTYVMKVYYDPNPAGYKLNYYKLDPDSGEYKYQTCTSVLTGVVGNTYTAETADADYAAKYNSDGYNLSTVKTQETSVKITNSTDTFIMNVYYDPAKAAYKTLHYVQQPDASYKLMDTVPGESTWVGKTVTAVPLVYAGYRETDTEDTLKTDKVREGDTTVLKLYYNYEVFPPKYKVEHYIQKKDGTYELYKSIEDLQANAGDSVTASVLDIKNYTHAVVDGLSNETDTVLADSSTVLKVYYNLDTAKYTVDYYKFNPTTKQYDRVAEDSSKVIKDGFIGETKTVTDIDSSYGTKYPKYKVNTVETGKAENSSVYLTEAGKTYVMKVYYDLEPAGYKLNYFKYNVETGIYDYVESTASKDGIVGKTYAAKDADDKYETKYSADGYTLSTVKTQEDSVEITNNTDVFEMNVYYDPAKATYKTEYYLQQPDGAYKLHETIQGEETWAGTTVNAQNKTYTGYKEVTTGNTLKTDKVKSDNSTVLKVYYNYAKEPTYKVEHYIEQPDGTFKLYKSIEDIAGITGEEVKAEILSIDGYRHITNTLSHEKDTVLADSSTILKVYYKAAAAKYSVKYYFQDKNNTTKYILNADENVEADANIDDVVKDDIYKKDFSGYKYKKIAGKSISEIIVKEDGTSELRLYYVLNPPVYSVQYYVEEENGNFVLVTEDSKTGIEGKNEGDEVSELDEDKYEGYIYTVIDDGTNKSNEKDAVAGDSSTVLKYYYRLPIYRTEYYVEQPDGTFKLLSELTEREKSKLGVDVTALIKDIDGYKHVVIDESLENDTVRNDSLLSNQTVLKVYYKIDAEEETTEEETEEETTEEITTEEITTEEETEEETTEEITTKEVTEVTTTYKANDDQIPPKKTGDEADYALFGVMVTSLAVVAGCVFARKKKRDEE